TTMEENYAAAGGMEQRLYPWGSDPAPDRQHALFGSADASALLGVPVGSLSPTGDGLWGQADLAGSLAEWMLGGTGPNDLYGGDPECTLDCFTHGKHIENEHEVDERDFPGGGFDSPAMYLDTSWTMRCDSPLFRSASVGFRCARVP